MATDIVSGLFGLAPYQIQQQRNQSLQDFANQQAQMNATQRGVQGMITAGGQLAGAAAPALGMIDPAMQQAQISEQVMAQGGDIGTSKGLLAKAEQFRQAGDLRTATRLTMAGKELEREEAKQALAVRKQEFEEKDKLDLKKQALLQQYELAKARAADRRAAEADRMEARREANQIKMLLAADKTSSAKPMPASIVKLQDEKLAEIGTLKPLDEQLGNVISQIDEGKLNLGPISNLMNRAKTGMSMSSEESVALANFETFLEKLRNDTLLLQKGTQTEGDAQRALASIVKSINDPKVVRSQLAILRDKNRAAAAEKEAQIAAMRAEYGKPALPAKSSSGVWSVVK